MISEDEVSNEFRAILLVAGWTPDRKISIAAWIDRLVYEGFRLTPKSLDILESMGGLRLTLLPAGISPYEHELWFDPLHAASGEADRAHDWLNEIGVDLFPLGQEVTSGNIIWAGSDCKMYYGRGFGLYSLGDTFGAAMDQLAFPQSLMVCCAE